MIYKRKFILLISLITIVHMVLYVVFIRLFNENDELSIQINTYKKVTNAKLLLLGDSHVARSIDVSQIDSSYSLAYFGENNMMNYYKLKYCLMNNFEKPRYIILPCDIITYSTGFNKFLTNKYFYYSLIPFSEVSNLSNNTIFLYYDYLKIKLIPYTEWRYALNRMDLDRQKKSNNKFSDKSIKEQEIDAKKFIQDEILICGDKNNLYDKNSLNYLQKTILLCKDNNIKLVFIKFPLTYNIFNEIKFHVDSTYILNRPSEKIINQQRIPILDFENLFINHNELFFDSHHLNLNGRMKFTEIFKQKLDSLYNVY